MIHETFTHRERLIKTLRFQPVDRPPDYEFGAWVQTIDRWGKEGMDVPSLAGLGRPTYYLEHFFGTDDDEYGPTLNINVGLLPRFDEIILEDHGQTILFQDSDGAISEQLKPEFGASIPRYIRYAIQDRSDWEHIRDERLNPDHPERIPVSLNALANRLKDVDYPITIKMGSLYGWIRNWMGVENLSFRLYDDYPFVEEMMEHLTMLALNVLAKLAGKGFQIDRADWWEDMCYRSGSLLSPRMFTQLMLPRYKRITDFLRREFGTEFNQLDCDGNIHQLVSLWLDGGINVMFPIESAHTDPFRIFEQFGKTVAMRGAFDKRALIEGPAAIDTELARLQPLIQKRGFIPHTDHLVPPDVSWENYLYYRRKKCEIIGKPWREPGVRQREGCLVKWKLLGPFDNPQNKGFHLKLPPELEPGKENFYYGKDGQEISWQIYQSSLLSGYINLAEKVSQKPWCVAFAICEVFSPTERESWVELGSDDGIQVWINDDRVCYRDVYHLAAPAQDLIQIHLRQGWNRILCKIGQAQGDWGFLFRLTDDRGKLWQDLEIRV